ELSLHCNIAEPRKFLLPRQSVTYVERPVISASSRQNGGSAMAGNAARIRVLIAVALLFSLALPSLAHAQTASFIARRDFPSSVVVADFNGDGRLDLAVTGSSNEVSILINNTSQASYALTVSETGNGSGTVTSSPAGINSEPSCTASYASGMPVTLTAQPAMGSNFAGWSGCDRASGATCTVTMNAAKSPTAGFNLQRFALTVSKEGVGRSGERSTV